MEGTHCFEKNGFGYGNLVHFKLQWILSTTITRHITQSEEFYSIKYKFYFEPDPSLLRKYYRTVMFIRTEGTPTLFCNDDYAFATQDVINVNVHGKFICRYM